MSERKADSDLKSVSVRLDGRASIEHQIDIHVQDLCTVSAGDYTLEEILQGLKYVLDYRIKGKKMPNLDKDLMKKLAEGLLNNMGWKEGNLINKKLTEEAHLAFTIFAEFLQEVVEFRMSVGEINAVDLQHSLKIHRRLCNSSATDIQKETSVFVIGLLTSSFPQFSDWKELVKESEHDDVEKILKQKQYNDLFYQKALPTSDGGPVYPPPALYFEKNYEKLAQMYGTDLSNGLTSELINEYKNFYGPNKLPESPKNSIISMLWTQLSDFMVVILIIVAIVEVAVDRDYKAFAVLIAVVIINVAIGFYQELKATKALDALSSLSVPKATVIRNGKQKYIDSIDLVPGDLVVLDEGDAVPADLRMVEVSQLEVVEAILTGEGIPVVKSVRSMKRLTRKLPLGDCTGNAFMTTVVAKGRGKGIVVRTGENTEIGKISKAIVQQPHQKTSLEKKLKVLGMFLVAAAILLSILIVVIGILWGRDSRKMILSGIALAVSVIPEGLVAVVTITMAIGVQRMASQGAIVRKLPSVETLGSVTHICSDKTGTLTEGKMGTGEIWTSNNSLFTFSESTALDPAKGKAFTCKTASLVDALALSDKPFDIFQQDDTKNPIETTVEISSAPSGLLASCLIASLCNNSSVVFSEESNLWKPIGDPTEIAMTTASRKAGFPRDFWLKAGFEKMGEFPFDSDRKLMSSVFKCTPTPTFFEKESGYIFAKGAPEQILNKCVGYLPDIQPGKFLTEFADMKYESMTKHFGDCVTARGLHMAHSGLRVLALAVRKVDVNVGQEILDSKKTSESEKDLVFVGLIGLIDPPKAGVADSVASCKKAGIHVIMITGDHIATASSIATQIGIMDPNDPKAHRAMRGYEVDLLTEDVLATLKPFPVVFARVSPDNKLKIVKALQSVGASVAMTGDGVNDAPAIKKADVGVAMGIGGTEITKQAADIVLADDNFTTIVSAVKEGRKVFDNIRKFAVYLLSCNSAEIILFILCVSFNLELPFSTIQILWANIIADIPPSLALGVEPFEADIMDRPPKPVSEAVLHFESIIAMVVQGLIISVSSFVVYILSQGPPQASDVRVLLNPPSNVLYPSHPTIMEQRSITFFFLTSLQLVQGFMSQSIIASMFTTGLSRNKWMVYAIILSFSCLIGGFYIPGLNDFLELKPLIGIDWAVMFIGVVIHFTLVELCKLAGRKYRKRRDERKRFQPVSRSNL